ncbi:tudor domain-containing protein 15 [Trichosurus vulpecula]|uniref:tudor domain-containing protein 15 n=1 Tax=Trichosurus vulpecula TaxID=9337 RepID=UPI00186AE556|nr:tudor domain-containing protein 15 [Trichosurus vulpecula]
MALRLVQNSEAHSGDCQGPAPPSGLRNPTTAPRTCAPSLPLGGADAWAAILGSDDKGFSFGVGVLDVVGEGMDLTYPRPGAAPAPEGLGQPAPLMLLGLGGVGAVGGGPLGRKPLGAGQLEVQDPLTMNSKPPFPPSLDMALKISHIECLAKEILVKFQGRYDVECEFDYHILHSEIQHIPKACDNVGVGEFCLVEEKDSGEWHRGQVVENKNQFYKVFLIDCGKELRVSATHVASASENLFELPPRMAVGVFANILPLGEKWSPKALNYFMSLVGLQVKGHVQAILPHQMVLLEVPRIISDLLELQLGRLVDGGSFHLIIEMLKEFPPNPSSSQMPDLLQQQYKRPSSSCSSKEISPNYQHVLDNLQQSLPVNCMKSVKIASAVSPSRFYCHLTKWLPELENLTTTMSLHYEAISREKNPPSDNFGLLCVAKRRDRQWYRGVLQQLLPHDQVRIWFMDLGNSEAVPSRYVKKLKQEFSLGPLFSFPCSLSHFSNPDRDVRNFQLQLFKRALLGQMMFAYIDRFDPEERLYYVTFYSQELVMSPKNLLLANRRPLPQSLMLEEETSQPLGDGKPSLRNSPEEESFTGNSEPLNSALEKDPLSKVTVCWKTVEMKVNSAYVAFVEYVLNPSNFWVRTNDHQNRFQDLMKKIGELYDSCEKEEMILKKPEPGLFCCARYNKDMHFYRAVITEVNGYKINVYFLDFGNTESVPFYDVKILLQEFCELPALAMCCSLAHAYPTEDIWVKKATDFFKKTVFDKALLLHVVAKKNDKYTVDVQCTEASGKVNVVGLMVQAGYAECWEVKPECLPKLGADVLGPNLKPEHNLVVAQAKQPLLAKSIHSSVSKSEFSVAAFTGSEKPFPRNLGHVSGTNEPLHPYKEYVFKPGTIIDVKCSYFSCPGDFSCQLRSKLPALMLLMERMQRYYGTHRDPYQEGQVACVARYAKDGQWYRAAVLTQVSPREVNVIFVDYGNQERILINDLCAINPDFLILEGQAFRCSLNNLIEPVNSESFNWTTKSCIDFGNFISSYDGQLTCIIYALVLIHPNCLCNIVDLQTPFISAQEFLVNCGCAQHSAFLKYLPASVSLYSFCYSSFNLKIGSEEEVYISHIQSPKKFYCQLRRNSQSLEVIAAKIAEINNLSNYPKFDGKTRLCLSRYLEDGFFYRAIVSPVDSSSCLLVYFVDFGNKQIVEGNKLMPILDHSPELLFTPMQAIKCYLSDLRDVDIPAEINMWFEENFLGKPLKAVIVSRDSDAQLGLELYDGNQQINQKVKTLLQVYGNKKDQGKCMEKFNKKYENKMLSRVSSKDKVYRCPSPMTKTSYPRYLENKVDPIVNSKDTRITLLKSTASFQIEPVIESKPSKERPKNTNGKTSPGSASHLDFVSKGKPVRASSETCIARQGVTPSRAESMARPHISDLPPLPVHLNVKVKGYVSNIWSPASFHIQLVENEDLIFKLERELNREVGDLDRESKPIALSVGDLVVAKYAADNTLYRAVIKNVVSRNSFEVEFIDYGNTETVNLSQIHELDRKFLTVPQLGLHSFLSGVRYNEPDELWDSKTIAYFAEKVNNKLISCEFLKKHEQKWEVNIICDKKCVVNEMMKWIACSKKREKVSKTSETLSKRMSLGIDSKEKKRSDESKCPRASCYQPAKIPSPELKPGQLEKAEILHVSKGGNFSVKLSKNAQVSSSLLSLIVKEAKENPFLPVENIEEGLECLTKSRITASWCRAKVEKCLGEEKMLVYLLDCGRYEVVPLLGTKELGQEIRSISQQAVPCKWIWIENARKMSFESIAHLFAHLEIKILFLRYLSAAWEVEILVDGLLLLEYLNLRVSQSEESKQNHSESLSVELESPVTSFRVNPVRWAPLQSGQQYRGFATAISDPSDFCVQPEDFFDTMTSLCRLLLALPDHLPTLPPQLVIPGSTCLFRYGWEDQWNRVEISEVSTQSVLLLFMDYGFSVCIPLSAYTNLKVIPEELLCLPRLTYRCALSGILPANGDHWEEAAKAFFQDLLSKPGLFFQFQEYSPGTKLEVEVIHGKNRLADLLVVAGHAVFSKEEANFVAVDSIQSTKIEYKLQGRHFHPLLDKVSLNENVLLTCTGQARPQQWKFIPWKDVYKNIFGKATPGTCFHSRNLTLRKKAGNEKNKSKSIKFETCERNTFWEQHNHLRDEPSCSKNIPENLPPGGIWKTYNLCTRIKALNINEEMVLEENSNKEEGENLGHLCISVPTTIQKGPSSGSPEACCRSTVCGDAIEDSNNFLQLGDGQLKKNLIS